MYLPNRFRCQRSLHRNPDARPRAVKQTGAEAPLLKARSPAPGDPGGLPALSSLEVPKSGGADRDRTGDPLLAKQVLSQLSYSPILNMVGLGRFELPTSPLSGVRSNQLSYRPGMRSG